MTILRNGFLAFLLCGALPASAQNPPTSAPKPLPTLRRGAPHTAVSQKAAAQLASSVDAGDAYRTPAGRRKLLRLSGAVAISGDSDAPALQRQLTAPGQPLARYTAAGPLSRGVMILHAPATGKSPQLKAAPAFDSVLKSVRATEAGKTANPVFIDPTTGLRLLATTELIACLKPGTDAGQFFGLDWPRVQPLWGTTNQFVLSLPDALAEDVLARVDQLSERAEVEWAEPNFMMQVERTFTPDDEFFLDQWGLNNDGQFGGSTNAHVRASAAWEITQGSSNIVIAIMDDGVQLDHPDLAANIFTNPGEASGVEGFDDDANGFTDDVHGWNIYAKNNDPGPSHATDVHGTALTGVAAAVGGNGLGISGVAPRCKILPLKVIGADGFIVPSEISRMLLYAAGLNAQGLPVWRGADVINISLLFGRSATVDSALNTAATKGRGGKGCAIFCAAGNGAGAWVPYEVEFVASGYYTLRWEYTKDMDDSPLLSIGADTVWLDNIVFPNGIVESFEGDLPDGWFTGGNAVWQIVTDGVNGNRALTGWNGPGSRSIRAGRITHDQFTYLELADQFIDSGVLRFWAWTESEAAQIGNNVQGYDIFHFYVDNGFTNAEIDYDFGVPLLEATVAYPASHPAVFAVGASTDFDYRADYSAFGAALDFVAPSDGGNAAVSTTDRTGRDGYNTNSFNGDFTHDFGGTSSASPLAAGVAALVLSVNPYLSVPELRALLNSTCDHIGDVPYDDNGFNSFYGHGRINAERAVKRARPNLIVTVATTPNPVVLGDTTTYTVSVRNNGTAVSGPVLITNQLPAGVAPGLVTPAPAQRIGNQLVFSAGNMASGALLTFRIVATNLALGTNINTASAGTDIPESVTGDNTATLQTTVVPIPLLSIGNATAVTEGDTAATNAVFVVSLSNPSSRAITVRYAAASGAATLGRDFAAASGLLRFAPGETAKAISVRVLPDRLDEDDENFFVNLSAPVNATIVAGQGIGRILDNDPLPSISVGDARRGEGNAGTAPMVFTVRLSAPSGRPVSAQFETASGSAVEGIDFARTNGTLIFPPGRTVLTIPVRLIGDTAQETNEMFFLNFSAPVVATIADGQGTGTIVNDDATPRLFISNTTVAEGDDGETNAVFHVRLTPASGLTVQVAFATTNGSAGGLDYAATNGLLVFAPGETNQTIVVPVSGDTLSESNEFFSVRLSAPANASLGGALARATILDNDPSPTLSISDATVMQATNATTNLVFTATLSAISGKTVTVRFATSNGTALARSDFVPKSGLLTFPPGVTSREISVIVNRAVAGESDESFVVNLSVPVNATLADGQGTGSILTTPIPLAQAGGFRARINLRGDRR